MNKKLYIFILIIITIAMIGLFSKVYAGQPIVPEKELYLERFFSNGIGYQTGAGGGHGRNIWNIVESTPNPNNIFYCVNQQIGFGAEAGSFIPGTIYNTYNYQLNLRDKTDMAAYATAVPWVNDDTRYNSILWILDNMVAFNSSYAGVMKTMLLKAAGLNESTTELTNVDIDIIQRHALWYYTQSPGLNFGQVHETTNGSLWDEGSYDLMLGDKQQEAEQLYKYLINLSGTRSVSYYGTGNIRNNVAPALAKATTTKSITTVGGEYVAGPFRINETAGVSESLYNLIYSVTNQSGVAMLTKLSSDAAGSVLLSKVPVGSNFYVVYTAPGVTTVNLAVTAEYFQIDGANAVWVNSTEPGDNQPVIKVVKERKTVLINDSVGISLFSLQILKVDNNTFAPLDGVKFTIESEAIPGIVTKTTASGGKIILNDLEGTGDIEFTITEIEGLPNYEDIGSITFAINRNVDTEEILIYGDGMDLVDEIIGNYYTISAIDGVITITIENEKTKTFDLAFRKYITKVNGTPLANTREPNIDLTGLKNGTQTTADYKHRKDPVQIETGDIVTYMLRAYNEGDITGYVLSITDILPIGLEFVPGNKFMSMEYIEEYAEHVYEEGHLNPLSHPGCAECVEFLAKMDETEYGYDFNETTRELKIFSKSAIDKMIFLTTGGSYLFSLAGYDGGEELANDGIEIDCEVTAQATSNAKRLTNVATMDYLPYIPTTAPIYAPDDSAPNVFTKPSQQELPDYKGHTSNKTDLTDPNYHYKGQEDDDDFEKLILIEQTFDLALRKFITGVRRGEKDLTVSTRAPIPMESEQSDRDIFYKHDKTPVEVRLGDLITYTIRVYNEGTMSGIVDEITDLLPEGLKLADHSTNTQYGWKERTVSEKKEVYTDYWSLAKATARGDNPVIAPRDYGHTLPGGLDYKDVKIVCEVTFVVTLENKDDAKRTLRNEAEITAYTPEGQGTEDKDSTGNKRGKYKYTTYKDTDQYDNEDGIDFEQVKVQYFDLGLRKWVTDRIEILNGQTTTWPSGQTAEDNPKKENVVSQINEKDINEIVVKFKYSIKVDNHGEIEGYVKEIKDHIPAGLKFIAEDNPDWVAIDEKTVKTENAKDKQRGVAIKDVLLKPGESVTVDIILTWINDANNMGKKENYAQISVDKNESDTPDINSDPNNWEPGRKLEDDEDYAIVQLTPVTGTAGKSGKYIIIPTMGLSMLAGGVFLIKKKVLA